MAIRRYEGQALPSGTIVCRESMLTLGFCSRPVEVVRETNNMIELRDLSDRDDVVRRKKSGIAFICDTADEGWRLHEASMNFVKQEQETARRLARELSERKRVAIAAALQAALGGGGRG